MSFFKPGCYYQNQAHTLNEIRQLEGQPPPQGDLSNKDLVLSKDRWKYRVVWSHDVFRIGAVFEVTPQTFRGWAVSVHPDWWARVDAGELVYNHDLGFWLDKATDEIVITMPDRQCNECGEFGSQPEQRFPAWSLRAFLDAR